MESVQCSPPAVVNSTVSTVKIYFATLLKYGASDIFGQRL